MCDAYEDLFGRYPDEPGADHWQDRLDSGRSESQVRDEMRSGARGGGELEHNDCAPIGKEIDYANPAPEGGYYCK